jgi:hypothetical protein
MPRSKKKATPAKSAALVARSAQEAATPIVAVGKSELDLPAGFTADGSCMATLREVLDPKVPTRALRQLSEDHRFDLAAKRIEMSPETFRLVIPGHGTIDKVRGVAEVRDRSRIGRHLAELQCLAINRATKLGKLARRQER